MVLSLIWPGKAVPLPNFNPIRIEIHRSVAERKVRTVTVQPPSSFLPAKSLNLKPSQKLTYHQRIKRHIQLFQHIHKCKQLQIQAHRKLAALEGKPYVPTLPSFSTPRNFSMAKPLSFKGLTRMTSRGSRSYRISTRVSFFNLAETASNLAAGGEALYNVIDKSRQSTQQSKKAMKLYHLYEQQEEKTRLAIQNVALQCQITQARMFDLSLNRDGISSRFLLAGNQLDSTNLHYIRHSLLEKRNSQPLLDHCFCMQNLGLSDPEIIIPSGVPFLKASVLCQTSHWISFKQTDSVKSLTLEEPLDRFIEPFLRDQQVLGQAFVSMYSEFCNIEKSNPEAHNSASTTTELFSIHLKKGSDRYNEITQKAYSQTDFAKLFNELNYFSSVNSFKS